MTGALLSFSATLGGSQTGFSTFGGSQAGFLATAGLSTNDSVFLAFVSLSRSSKSQSSMSPSSFQPLTT